MGKTRKADPAAGIPKRPSIMERASRAAKDFDKRNMDRMPESFKRMHEKPKKKAGK